MTSSFSAEVQRPMMRAILLGRLAPTVVFAGLVTFALGVTWTPGPRQAYADPGATNLFAIYKVYFAGMKLGKFKAWVNSSGDRYWIEGKANLALGFIIRGLFFKLDGTASSSGTLDAERVLPTGYSLSYESKRSSGRLKMEFEGNVVSQVLSQPPMRLNPDSVQITESDITNVLDPLSAVFAPALSKRGGLDAAICRQQVAIFDGKHRFNLTLSHKRTVQVHKKGRRGYSGPALVCRVMYTPVSGHRPGNKGVVFMRSTRDIEAWFIPVPGSRVYVLYHISIPTLYGLATATSTVFEVNVSGRRKLALVR